MPSKSNRSLTISIFRERPLGKNNKLVPLESNSSEFLLRAILISEHFVNRCVDISCAQLFAYMYLL